MTSKDSFEERLSSFEQIKISSEEKYFSDEECLRELDHSSGSDELKLVVASVNLENRMSESLFIGKYQIFLFENLLPWQKPTGDYFRSALVICGVRKKTVSESEDTSTEEAIASECGNPLTVQFESFFSQNSEENNSLIKTLNTKYDLYPLPECIGRKLLYMCTAFENSLKLPFIIICHGVIKKSMVLYGGYVQDKSFRLRAVNQGTVSSSENLPLMRHLKEMHLEGFASSKQLMEASVAACYTFLGYRDEDKSSVVPVKDSNTTIECSWSDAKSVLEPLNAECTCIVKLRPVAGDDETGAFHRYKEIKLIKSLRIALLTGVMEWTNSVPGSITKKLKDLINEEKDTTYAKKLSAVVDTDSFDDIVIAERGILDFPDQLWIVLRNCTCYEELKDGLSLVYTAMKDLLLIHPYVFKKNKSSISNDVRKMISGDTPYPSLNSKTIVQLLLEIGIEKLRHDYAHIFSRLELVPHDLINQFLQPDLLSDEAITELEKLHTVLELVIICKKQLNLPKKIVSEFARNALKLYASVPHINFQEMFSFHIPAVYARPLLNLMRPITWELSLVSSDKNFMKHSIHRFVTTATHEHIYAPPEYPPNLMLKDASYVYLSATLVETTLPDLE